MNSVIINLHDYYSNYVFLHNFTQTDANEFWAQLASMWFFSIIKAVKHKCECSNEIVGKC